MNYDKAIIEGRDLEVSKTVLLRIGLKSNEGELFLDARKWLKHSLADGYFPSKKGLMLRLNDWARALPLIQKFLDENIKS